MKIVVTGGGTGGHLFPALLISEKLISEGHNVYYFGNPKCIEKEEANKRGIPFYSVPSRNTLKKDVKFVIDNSAGVIKSLAFLRKIKPDVVYSTGGFTTAPVLAAATYLKIPIVLHEQNAVVGLVNRIFRKSASSFIHSYPYDKQDDEKVVGNLSRYKGNIQRTGQYIVFMGGSGGAKFVNEIAVQYAKDNPHQQVVLLSGKNFDIDEQFPNLTVHSFVENMLDIYRSADIVVARAGSTTLAELSYLGIPSIIIPMPNSADNHQEKNADFFEWKNAIIKITQDEYAYYTLNNAINKMSDSDKKRMSDVFKMCYNNRADEQIVKEILRAGNSKK